MYPLVIWHNYGTDGTLSEKAVAVVTSKSCVIRVALAAMFFLSNSPLHSPGLAPWWCTGSNIIVDIIAILLVLLYVIIDVHFQYMQIYIYIYIHIICASTHDIRIFQWSGYKHVHRHVEIDMLILMSMYIPDTSYWISLRCLF